MCFFSSRYCCGKPDLIWHFLVASVLILSSSWDHKERRVIYLQGKESWKMRQVEGKSIKNKVWGRLCPLLETNRCISSPPPVLWGWPVGTVVCGFVFNSSILCCLFRSLLPSAGLPAPLKLHWSMTACRGWAAWVSKQRLLDGQWTPLVTTSLRLLLGKAVVSQSQRSGSVFFCWWSALGARLTYKL